MDETTFNDRITALEKSVNFLQTQANNFATLTSVSKTINYLNAQIIDLKQELDSLTNRVTSLEQRM